MYFCQNFPCPHCLITQELLESYCRFHGCLNFLVPLTQICAHFGRTCKCCQNWNQYFHNFYNFYTSYTNFYHSTILYAYYKFLTAIFDSCQCKQCQTCKNKCDCDFGSRFGCRQNFNINRMGKISATVQCTLSDEKKCEKLLSCKNLQTESCSICPKESICYEILFPKCCGDSNDQFSIQSLKCSSLEQNGTCPKSGASPNIGSRPEDKCCLNNAVLNSLECQSLKCLHRNKNEVCYDSSYDNYFCQNALRNLTSCNSSLESCRKDEEKKYRACTSECLRSNECPGCSPSQNTCLNFPSLESSLESCQINCRRCHNQCIQTSDSVDSWQKTKDRLLAFYKNENVQLRKELNVIQTSIDSQKIDNIIDFYRLENKILKKQLEATKQRLGNLKSVIKENCASAKLRNIEHCPTSPRCLHRNDFFGIEKIHLNSRAGGVDSDSKCHMYKYDFHCHMPKIGSDMSDISKMTFTMSESDNISTNIDDGGTSPSFTCHDDSCLSDSCQMHGCPRENSLCQFGTKQSTFHLHDEITMTSSQSFTVLSSVKKKGRGNVTFPKTDFAIYVYEENDLSN